jgi:hypothetical protein
LRQQACMSSPRVNQMVAINRSFSLYGHVADLP